MARRTLGQIRSKKVDLRRTVTVDISAFTIPSEEDGPDLLVFKEPDAPAYFQAGQDTTAVETNNAAWPLALCKTVSLLAACHISPEEDENMSTLQFYIDQAKNSNELFLHVLDSFSSAFPAVEDFQGAIDEAKNGLSATVLAEPSSTSV